MSFKSVKVSLLYYSMNRETNEGDLICTDRQCKTYGGGRRIRRKLAGGGSAVQGRLKKKRRQGY